MKGGKALKIFSFTMAVILLHAFAGQAYAKNDPPQIAINIEVLKETVSLKEGKEEITREPVFKTEAGDLLFYSLTYTNTGNSVATNAAVVDPIPEGTVYLTDSADGAGTTITYSIDGGSSFQGPPVTYLRKKPDGSMEQAAAPPEMYTHIKWMLNEPLEPGNTGTASFKVTVK